MKRDEAQFDKVERYLRGELSEEENLAMEKAIAEDPDLAEELEFQQLELDAMELIIEDKLRGKMESWEKSPPPPPKGRKGGFRFLIAGVFIFGLIILGFYYWPSSQIKLLPSNPTKSTEPAHTAPEDTTKPPVAIEDQIKDAIKIPKIDIASTSLAMNTYELPEDLKGALKSTDESASSPLDPGLKAFSTKDYRKAVVEFTKIQPSEGEDIYLRSQEVLGHAYFLSQRYAQAVRVFETLAKNQDYNTLRQDAEWYLILALLPNYSKNQSQIDSLLVPILDPLNYHNYREQALNLQKKIIELQ